jgi:hypothetical protein
MELVVFVCAYIVTGVNRLQNITLVLCILFLNII